LTHKSTILLLMRTITITINVRRRMHKVTHGKINLISSVLFAPLTCPNCSTTLFIYASVDVSTQSISLSSAIDIQEFEVIKLKVSTQTLDLNTLLFIKSEQINVLIQVKCRFYCHWLAIMMRSASVTNKVI
jgi:hypothetical protein